MTTWLLKFDLTINLNEAEDEWFRQSRDASSLSNNFDRERIYTYEVYTRLLNKNVTNFTFSPIM